MLWDCLSWPGLSPISPFSLLTCFFHFFLVLFTALSVFLWLKKTLLARRRVFSTFSTAGVPQTLPPFCPQFPVDLFFLTSYRCAACGIFSPIVISFAIDFNDLVLSEPQYRLESFF